jgi:hypothetical protein
MTNLSGTKSPAPFFWPQTLFLSPVHLLMPFPYSISQRIEHIVDTRSRRRLQPPLGLARGSNRFSRSDFQALHPLLHLVRDFIAITDHRWFAVDDHQDTLARKPVASESSPFPSSPSLLCPSDRDPTAEIRIRTLKRYRPIDGYHVAGPVNPSQI